VSQYYIVCKYSGLNSVVKAVPHILSPAVRLGDTLYCSGQTPIDASGKVVDGDIEELTTYVQPVYKG
jgi:enamine deaminase RidA (YjgF/YER057c/UK114 family)